MKKTTRLMSLIIAAALILSGCNQNNVVSHQISDASSSETTTTATTTTTSVTTTEVEATTTTTADVSEIEETTPATTVSFEETTVPVDVDVDIAEDTTTLAETTEIITEQVPVETTTTTTTAASTTAATTTTTARATTTETVVLAYTSAIVAGNPEPPHIYVIHVDKNGNEEYDWNSVWNDMGAGVFTQTIYAKELDQALENAFKYWEETYGNKYGKAVAKVIYYTGETIIYSRSGSTPATTTAATTTVKPAVTTTATTKASTTVSTTKAQTTAATTAPVTATTSNVDTTIKPSNVSFIDDYKSRYLYGQLSDIQKKWYDYIFNKVRYGSTAKKPTISSNDHTIAQLAYEISSPHAVIYNLSEEDRKSIETIANRIVTKALKENTPYNQLKVIHDELCDIAEYGGNQSWRQLFLKGKGICYAYADAFTYLCQLAGYDCFRVPGYAYDGTKWGGHEWNLVKVDGKWYYVDVTWDDGGWGTKWFLKGEKTMDKDHRVETGFTSLLPVVSASDYKA
ncbi:MAG: hypothetical protein IK990_10185 [Ruminiclostridium sp.]|nr:hypothetical protein [Ruminiclostridium sp.]